MDVCIKCGEEKVRVIETTGKRYVKMCFNCGDRFIEEKEEQPKKRRWFK